MIVENPVCEKCYYFQLEKQERFIDCLNKSISQDDYMKYFAKAEQGCPYFKERNDTIGC